MKKINLFLLLAFLFAAFNSQAQFNFQIEFDFDTERYVVSLIPEISLTAPQNITGDGQVTIKVRTNQFIPVDIENGLEGMKWEVNSRNDSPIEAPEFDYISFGLQMEGLGYPEYEAGVPIPIFSFQNAYGCLGSGTEESNIYLVDNDTDPFMPPNSSSANIGNYWATLGTGSFSEIGLYNGGVANCDPANPTSTAEELGFTGFSIFPNPVAEELNVTVEWEGEKEDVMIQMVDGAGKLVHAEPLSIAKGTNTKNMMVAKYPAGNYFLYLVAEDWEVSLDKLTKQ